MQRPIAFHQLSTMAQRFIDRRLQEALDDERQEHQKDDDDDSALNGHGGTPVDVV